MKRNTIVALFLLLALLLAGCAGTEEMQAPPLREPAGMEQDIVTVTRGNIERVQTYSGLVLPEVLELSFTDAGLVTEVLVSVGSQVKAGQVVARLNTASLESALDSARQQLEYSETEHELNRKKRELQLDIARLELEELKNYGASSTTRKLKQTQIEEQENQLEEFEALWELSRADMARNVEELEKQVSAGVLSAPCDGTVVHCAAAEGSYAMANNPLIWLAEADSARIRTEYLTA
ncbi:MAG: biotin/lipoyl-binding protein, partial [Oscillospiraceae bacterium]|nr:biotin/lipoyl-binding protein [Oscillospiraceae bacterium]